MQTISIEEFKKIRGWTYQTYVMLASQASGASITVIVEKTYEKILLSMEKLFLPSESNGRKSVERIVRSLQDS